MNRPPAAAEPARLGSASARFTSGRHHRKWWPQSLSQFCVWLNFCGLKKVVQINLTVLSVSAMPLDVDTRDARAVKGRVGQDYWSMFPDGDAGFVPYAFGLVEGYFLGETSDYLPIDARYHDFEHTLQGTLTFSSLLRGRVEAGAEPVLSQEIFELGLLAILLHDTGYLKRRDDTDGTGAKYTATHVNRSCDFAENLLWQHGYSLRQVHAIQHMIRCTGLGAKLTVIPFQSEEERIAGYALGTADLLGQMAARDYVEKLPILYEEFFESAQFNAGKGGPVMLFSSVQDLTEKTPAFWRKYVLPKIENDFIGLFRFLARPAPEGRNEYIEAIEANIQRLETRLALAALAA